MKCGCSRWWLRQRQYTTAALVPGSCLVVVGGGSGSTPTSLGRVPHGLARRLALTSIALRGSSDYKGVCVCMYSLINLHCRHYQKQQSVTNQSDPPLSLLSIVECPCVATNNTCIYIKFTEAIEQIIYSFLVLQIVGSSQVQDKKLNCFEEYKDSK